MRYRFLPALFLLLFAACDNRSTAYFGAPQPAGGRDLEALPAGLSGVFSTGDRTSLLRITDRLVIRTDDYDEVFHKDSLDGSLELRGNQLIYPDGATVTVVRKGDSVIRHQHVRDTLFSLAGGNRLRKFRGHYFLNTRYDTAAWHVQLLTPVKGMVILGYVSDSADIARLEHITATVPDSSGYVFDPSRRQLKRFIRQDGFSDRDTFYRMRTGMKG
jgi:hypothetical protein